MVDKEVASYYRRFRAVGESALQALRNAKTLQTWHTLEDQGLARINAEPEMENYFDVFGVPDDPREVKQIEDTLERLGCWWVCAEYFSPESETWEHADSIGMCVYDNPLSPFENCYVPDLMRAAIERLTEEAAAPQEVC